MCLDSTSVKDKRTQSVDTMTCSLDPTSVGEKHVQSVLHSSSVAAVNQIPSTQIIQHVSSDPTPVEEEQNMIFHNTSTVDSAISSVRKEKLPSTKIIQSVSSDPTPVEEEQTMIFHNTSTVPSVISSVPK